MIMDFYNRNKPIINKLLFIFSVIVFIYIFVNYLFYYVAPFVIGYIISLLLNPAADFFNNRYKIGRGVCAFFLIIISVLLLFSLGTAIVSKIRGQLNAFSDDIPYFAGLIMDFINNLRESVNKFVPDDFRETVDRGLVQLGTGVTGFLGSTIKEGSLNIVSSLPNVLFNTVVSFISAFFFIKDKYVIRRLFEDERVLRVTRHFSAVRSGLATALSGYFKAQFIIMAVNASICILGLTIMGNKYAIIIGLFAGILDFLPVFGIGTVFVPWILYSFFIANNHSQAVALCIIYAVGFLTRQMLEPKILGQEIGVHPLVTLMSVYIGLKVFGAVGLLIGPVIVVSVKIMLRQMQAEAHGAK